MTVALLPPITSGRPDPRVFDVPLERGPSFILKQHPQRKGKLWHRPRSGYVSTRSWSPKPVTVWDLWCGTSTWSHVCETRDRPPVDGAVCATCDGRAKGAGQIESETDYATSFTPRWVDPPRWCPGSGRSGLWIEHGPSTGRCGVCGIVAAVRVMGGWLNGDVGIVRHEPARDLLEVRCPRHGWRQLVLAGDRAVCSCSRVVAGT